MWKYRGNDAYSNRIYGFVRSEGVSLPGYAYQGLVISSDYSRMQMNYLFGFMGRMVPMYSAYRYLGEGADAANEWMYNR